MAKPLAQDVQFGRFSPGAGDRVVVRSVDLNVELAEKIERTAQKAMKEPVRILVCDCKVVSLEHRNAGNQLVDMLCSVEDYQALPTAPGVANVKLRAVDFKPGDWLFLTVAGKSNPQYLQWFVTRLRAWKGEDVELRGVAI